MLVDSSSQGRPLRSCSVLYITVFAFALLNFGTSTEKKIPNSTGANKKEREKYLAGSPTIANTSLRLWNA